MGAKPVPKKKRVPVVSPAVGEKRNYNFQNPDNYELWPFWTIEQLPEKEQTKCKCYVARVIVVGKNHDKGVHFAFNSCHQDFNDAERAIDFARAKMPTGELYNIFGETIDVHSSDIGDRLVTVAEVKVILWSMQDVS